MSRRHPGARHHSRQAALQVLYAFDLADRARSGPRPSDEEAFDRVASNFDLPAGARVFAKALVRGTVACRSELDAMLSPGFVNGVLDAVARGARAPGPAPAEVSR